MDYKKNSKAYLKLHQLLKLQIQIFPLKRQLWLLPEIATQLSISNKLLGKRITHFRELYCECVFHSHFGRPNSPLQDTICNGIFKTISVGRMFTSSCRGTAQAHSKGFKVAKLYVHKKAKHCLSLGHRLSRPLTLEL